MGRRRQAAGLLGCAGHALVSALVAVELVHVGLPLAVITAIGVLVGRVAEGGSVAVPLGLLSALLLAQQLLVPLRTAVQYSLSRRVDGRVRSRAMEAACGPAGIAHLEDATTVDRLSLARAKVEAHWYATPGGAAAAFVALGGRYLQVALAAMILAQVSPAVAAGLVALVAPCFVLSRRWAALRVEAHRQTHGGVGRASRYTSSLANTPPYAKETRLFGMLGWLLERFQGQWDEVADVRFSASRVAVRRTVALLAVASPLVALVFVSLGRAALDGDPDARGLAVTFQAAILIIAILDPRTDEIYQLDFGLAAHDALLEVQARLAGGDELAVTSGSRDAVGLPTQGIEFSGVRFSYGGEPVLDGLDLTIPAGSSLAVVGVNGAGKTTLVKLLAGLYVAQAGKITVDGIPLGDLDLASWRRQLGVIFQDFVRYELPASDNVGFGGLDHGRDREALERAAARAGAASVVGSLPGGWDTPLSRQYTGGSDLSGGQWQRVALARALFAVERGARVLVLDEPTANLDVRAEAELFDEFLDLTAGLTTILISHRFSTVRHADRVCVLDAGRIVEQGSHDELLRAGGRYSRLFDLQAARFRG